MNTFYILTFSMPESMNSYKGTSNPIENGVNVTSQMVKIGQCKGSFRKKDYDRTYGDFYRIEELWQTDLSVSELRKVERNLQKEFYDYIIFSPKKRKTEYFRKIIKKDLMTRIDLLLNKNNTEKESKTKGRKKMSNFQNGSISNSTRFIKGDKSTDNAKKETHIWRVEYIINKGKGRLFKEINADDSVYRRLVDRPSYKNNDQKILQDLEYDMGHQWIKIDK